MVDDQRTARQSHSHPSGIGLVRPTLNDRIISTSVDVSSDLDDAPRKNWTTHLLVIAAYIVMIPGFALPFPSPTVRFSFIAAVGLGVACFAALALPQSELHRKRLMIAGSAVGLASMYYALKPLFGL